MTVAANAGTFERIALELQNVVEPLASRLGDDRILDTLAELGVQFPPALLANAQFRTARQTITEGVRQLGPLLIELETAIAADDTAGIVAAATALVTQEGRLIASFADVGDALTPAAAGLPGVDPADVADLVNDLPRKLLDMLLADIFDLVPAVSATLQLLGILDRVPVPGDPLDPTKPDFDRLEVHLDRLIPALTDPIAHLESLYGWGESTFDATALLTVLEGALGRLGLPVLLRPGSGPTPPVLEAFAVDISPTTAGPPGLDLAVVLPGTIDTTVQIPISPPVWVGTVRLKGAIRAGVTGTLRAPFELELTPPTGDVTGSVTVGVEGRAPQPIVILGQAGASRLEVASASVQGGVTLHWNSGSGSATTDVSVAGRITGGRLVIDASQGDGFLTTVLGGARIESTFDFGIAFTPETGVRFDGSGGLEIQLPVHIQLGPIELQSIYLVGGLAGATIPIELSAGFSVDLGPIKASVDRLGAVVTVGFPAGGGNAGPADVSFAFKPPNGLGIVVDAGVVKGGGYLFLDNAKGEYAGALELTIADFLSLKAIGLINTRLPGGQPGFSLLVIITAEFSPGFQLGYGFTLIGVGGILGVNRSVLLDPLAQGVRTGAVNSILFPTNFIENAPRILSDLRAIFPPHEGIFLIGPMAKIGWGTPTLLSLSLGVLIEIPGNVVILGRIRLALPTDDEAVVVLQVTFIGALEFDKRRIWFFASLFDSRILFITLDGEMGLLMDFSDNPDFVLSVGGFHPRFRAPPLPFPSPARIAISLINESWARVRAEAYFAVTSNSVQMGCRAEAFFGFSAFSVEGYLSFDALLQLSPIYLIVEVSVGFSVKVFGAGVWGVHLRGSLEGPAPWRVRGSAEIEILFLSFDVDVDVTFGEERRDTLPPIAVLPQLVAEFTKLESWRATPPPSGRLFVNLRDVGAEEELILHPVGTLEVSQRFAPLNLPLDRIGAQKPSDINRASLEVASGALVVKGPTREKFAAAQYRDMDDAAKLSAPAYEPLDSGVELAPSGESWITGPSAERVARYETIILDTALEPKRIRFFPFWGELFVHFLGGAAIARSPISLAVKRRMQPFDEKVMVTADKFTVVFQADNRPFAAAATFDSFAEAQAHLSQSIIGNPALSETIHVIPAAEVSA
jgi:hypothetical protein